ncbi:J domain-containing protein [Roseomonas sp. NAR14]|uniref:J domain-containing protein n=1 Tax=Roseomonas acroporae TaxID=2937791 RepID=A0A9X2BX04_9PROT|nr:J domain-containing protein [Roseomonas acroporae]MCK8785444.1 J domain-containing protein [Roseomonas acroporae]
MARRGERLRYHAPDPDSPNRPCDAPGCAALGEFRAPQGRDRLRQWYWFCLDHVRAYNQSWDYYRGMPPSQIEAELRGDTTWQRPTWPLGRLGSRARIDAELLRDPLGLFAEGVRRRPPEPKAESAREDAPPELRAALDVLGLHWPVAFPDLRTRYKDLAKRHHPDANGGDRAAEERLKDINRAYTLLRHRLDPRMNGAAAAATG